MASPIFELEKKIKENRRLKKVYPEDDKDMPVYTYVSTNKNPVSRVFSWGTACYGALGNPQLLHPQRKSQEPKTAMHHPMRISDFEMQKVKDVACGYGYSLFAVNDKNGHVYGCGINNQGQFGYHAEVPDKPLQILIKPVPLKLPIDSNDKVKRMEAGQAHSVILTKNGQVFTLGSTNKQSFMFLNKGFLDCKILLDPLMKFNCCYLLQVVSVSVMRQSHIFSS